ncbi:MAG: DUF2225 domain-containing protein [Armatimonadetes bacterium]|nr:DUF2225 domain-containing protein [Armatimonadota bacterium]
MLDTAKLARAGFLRKYAAGEIICREGEPGAEMYIILQGKVEIVPGGDSPVTLAAGDFFGEMALLDQLPRSATVRVVEDAILLVLTENNFKEVIGAEPLLALRIMKGMSARLRRLDEELRNLKRAASAAAAEGRTEVAGDDADEEPEIIDFLSSLQISPAPVSAPDTEVQDPEVPDPEEALERKDRSAAKGLTANHGEGPPGASPAAAPVGQGRVLYPKKATCPVCGFTFPVTAFMASKLRMVRQDTELRNHYADFEPLLYSVWVCPQCYYAGPHDSFSQLNARQKAVLKENAPARRQKFGELEQEGSPARAIQGYLLILENLGQIGADPVQKGRSWLRLAWLYDDAGDEQNARQARKNALALFEEAYFTSTKVLSPEQEQQMAYLIGELKYRLGDEKEALHFWRRAVMQKGGNAQFTRQVQDRIYAVRGRGGKKERFKD